MVEMSNINVNENKRIIEKSSAITSKQNPRGDYTINGQVASSSNIETEISSSYYTSNSFVASYSSLSPHTKKGPEVEIAVDSCDCQRNNASKTTTNPHSTNRLSTPKILKGKSLHKKEIESKDPQHYGRALFRISKTDLRSVRVVKSEKNDSLGTNKVLKRNYQIHKGKNRFFLWGRLISVKDSILPWLLATVLEIALPAAFLITNSQWLLNQNIFMALNKIFFGLYIYIILIMLSSMLLTAFSDPGIIPRNLDLDPDLEEIKGEAAELSTDSEQPIYRAKPMWINMGDKMVSVKWCQTCQTYRVPKTSHCKVCDNCVDFSDHHCVFVNNCIGRRNYFSFWVFLFSMILIILMTIGICLTRIALIHRNKKEDEEKLSLIGCYLIMFISGIFGTPVIALWIFHVKLNLRNLTTIENLRPVQFYNFDGSKIISKNQVNLLQKGSNYQNPEDKSFRNNNNQHVFEKRILDYCRASRANINSNQDIENYIDGNGNDINNLQPDSNRDNNNCKKSIPLINLFNTLCRPGLVFDYVEFDKCITEDKRIIL
ncbi:DHHC palmitoyltransferase-domain-containing protein [Phakopsora pachyrhizi]|uniref:Palmitoyltransferase n=1 Tax=Phakopsora pachyrhizi TaxID=170000 RepID=A0AAV0BG07_PHAPC|nr:DHHC palmitoyltransferase-domain-containing protein [Phakopsora pachyrhizi]